MKLRRPAEVSRPVVISTCPGLRVAFRCRSGVCIPSSTGRRMASSGGLLPANGHDQRAIHPEGGHGGSAGWGAADDRHHIPAKMDDPSLASRMEEGNEAAGMGGRGRSGEPPCGASKRRRPAPDCPLRSGRPRPAAGYGRRGTWLLDPPVRAGNIRTGCRPDLPRAFAAGRECRSRPGGRSVRPFGPEPEQGQKFGQLHQPFGLAPLGLREREARDPDGRGAPVGGIRRPPAGRTGTGRRAARARSKRSAASVILPRGRPAIHDTTVGWRRPCRCGDGRHTGRAGATRRSGRFHARWDVSDRPGQGDGAVLRRRRRRARPARAPLASRMSEPGSGTDCVAMKPKFRPSGP